MCGSPVGFTFYNLGIRGTFSVDFVGVKNQVVNKKLQISGILKKSAIDFRYSISVMKTFLQHHENKSV